MDIFKFVNSDPPTLLRPGIFISGIKTKLWTERYRDFCTFELIANIDKMVHKELTIGSLISQRNSMEVMIVENHEITDSGGSETEIKISGRSFETIFENRIVGSNKSWPSNALKSIKYELAEAYTWQQTVQMLREHIYPGWVSDPNDAIPNLDINTNISGFGLLAEEIVVPTGDLYTRMIELMEPDDLGVKTIRPNHSSPFGYLNPKLGIMIHKGVDKSSSVIFSNISGEIENADYLWSNKNIKTAAVIQSTWFEATVKDFPSVPSSGSGYSRRIMFIDASDIDDWAETVPTGITRAKIVQKMKARGKYYLAAQRPVALINAQITDNANKYTYRKDYDVGDIVTVSGNYSETAKMQITEYVEIEDEDGEYGYPTLSAIE